MKKSLLSLLLLTAVVAGARAQDLISKVPSSSSLVIKYSGREFLQECFAPKVGQLLICKGAFV
jgi:hypothetical protein